MDNIPFYDAIAEHDDDDQSFNNSHRPSTSTLAALASALPNIYSYETRPQQAPSIEKYVNPLGTVTTITPRMITEVKTDLLDEVVSQLAAEESVIHENCDEALFRPVVAIFCDEMTRRRAEEEEETRSKSDLCKPPEIIDARLIVPVIAKELDDEMTKREKAKLSAKTRQQMQREQWQYEQMQQSKFAEMSSSNKKSNTMDAKKHEVANLATKTNAKAKAETSNDLEPSESKRMTSQPAEKIKCIKKENTDKDKKTITKNKQQSDKVIEMGDTKKSQVTTEILNMSALTDSLMELREEEEENSFAEETPEDIVLDVSEPLVINAESDIKPKLIKAPVKSESSTKLPQFTIKDKQLKKSAMEATEPSVKNVKSKNVECEKSESQRNEKLKHADDTKNLEQFPKNASKYPAKLDKEESYDGKIDVETPKKGETKMRLQKKMPEEEKTYKINIREFEIETQKDMAVDGQLLAPDNKEIKTEIMRKDKTKEDSSVHEEEKMREYKIKVIDIEPDAKEFVKRNQDKDKTKGTQGNVTKKENSKTVKTEYLNTVKYVAETKENMETKCGSENKSNSPKSSKKQNNQNTCTKETETKKMSSEVLTDQPFKVDAIKSVKKGATSEGSPKKANAVVDVPDGKQKKSTEGETSKIPAEAKNSSVAEPPTASAWKTLSGAEMISKNLEQAQIKSSAQDYPSLGSANKSKKSAKEDVDNLMTPPKTYAEFKEPLWLSSKKPKKLFGNEFTDFSLPKPFDPLPPLPALEPLEFLTGYLDEVQTASKLENIKAVSPLQQHSLINFESPMQDNVILGRKISPPPRGFSEQNLMFALCGSLHYENETSNTEKLELYSPTMSLTRSSSALGEQSTAEYKSLTENDEQYVSLEFSSQETNTTNTTTTTNEKLSSSSNASSASEEVIALDEKKMSKRQKRKLLKSKKDALVIKATGNEDAAVEEVDEELRPLIDNTGSGMSDSHQDSAGENYVTTHASPSWFGKQMFNLLNTNTTTDSDDPLPATTSDENMVFELPSNVSTPATSTPHKIKTKKLEHKINLIAAIEAATSSSTSSAEESGVEASSERRASLDVDDAEIMSIAGAATSLPLLALPATATSPSSGCVGASSHNSSTNGSAKKKTKRRKR